jgi:hypothetical protein
MKIAKHGKKWKDVEIEKNALSEKIIWSIIFGLVTRDW